MPSDTATVEKFIQIEKPVISVLEVRNEFFLPDQFFIDCSQFESELHGLHAVVLIGYGIDQVGQRYFIIRNSWGSSWGQDGYAFLSYQYYRQYWRGSWVIEA